MLLYLQLDYSVIIVSFLNIFRLNFLRKKYLSNFPVISSCPNVICVCRRMNVESVRAACLFFILDNKPMGFYVFWVDKALAQIWAWFSGTYRNSVFVIVVIINVPILVLFNLLVDSIVLVKRNELTHQNLSKGVFHFLPNMK